MLELKYIFEKRLKVFISIGITQKLYSFIPLDIK